MSTGAANKSQGVEFRAAGGGVAQALGEEQEPAGKGDGGESGAPESIMKEQEQ